MKSKSKKVEKKIDRCFSPAWEINWGLDEPDLIRCQRARQLIVDIARAKYEQDRSNGVACITFPTKGEAANTAQNYITRVIEDLQNGIFGAWTEEA